ncbi:MAG: protein-L-isoaspartate O-methyltransferase family protein [Pseudonocardiaceae bacterium]
MTSTDDPIAEAADLIDYDSYVLRSDGSRLPQSSAPASILSILRVLELQPGMRVLEVGTGSGYTGALLGRIVGEQGTVISLDIVPDLVARAQRKHSEHGVGNVAVHVTDGFGGWNAGAPYDRIVGWTAPHVLPRRWVGQAWQHAVIVTPVKVAPIAGANMILRVDVHEGRPIARDVHPGGYIEMHSEIITDFPVPVRYVDSLLRQDNHTAWVSAPALREHPDLADRAGKLIATGWATGSPFPSDRGVTVGACHGYLLARRPEGLASAGVGSGWGMGLVLGDSAAFLRPTDIYVAGTHHAEDRLRALLAEWEQAGGPGHTCLEPQLTGGPDGFDVRVTGRVPPVARSARS